MREGREVRFHERRMALHAHVEFGIFHWLALRVFEAELKFGELTGPNGFVVVDPSHAVSVWEHRTRLLGLAEYGARACGIVSLQRMPWESRSVHISNKRLGQPVFMNDVGV